MSIPVDLARLEQTLSDHGSGYLLTSSAEGGVKAVVARPTWDGDALRCPPSRGTAANLADNPRATLLFPPREDGGYTLLIDGTAVADDAGITLTPGSAVLHRPAGDADQADRTDQAGHADQAGRADGTPGGDGCGNDCAPVG